MWTILRSIDFLFIKMTFVNKLNRGIWEVRKLLTLLRVQGKRTNHEGLWEALRHLVFVYTRGQFTNERMGPNLPCGKEKEESCYRIFLLNRQNVDKDFRLLFWFSLYIVIFWYCTFFYLSRHLSFVIVNIIDKKILLNNF